MTKKKEAEEVKNEVAQTKGTAVSTEVDQGIGGQLSKDDVQQGRLAIMQSGSTLVKEEQARQGSIVNLVDGEEVAYKGNKDEPAKDLEFTICGIMKYWIEKDDDADKFLAKYPASNQNEKLWNEVVDGVNIKRTFHFSYVVLLPEEIEAGIEMPYELAFRSTAIKDTKKLNSIIDRMAKKGISSHDKVFKASLVERTKGTDKWWGLDLSIARDATEKEKQVTAQYFADFVKTKEQFMAQQDDAYAQTDAKANGVNTDDY